MKTELELRDWNTAKELVEALKVEIETLEAEQELNKEEVKKEVEAEVKEEGRSFDALKALRDVLEGRSNVSKFNIPELRSYTKASHADHYDKVTNFTSVSEGGILEKLGVTMYPNSKANIGLVFSKSTGAAFYAEGAAVADSAKDLKYATLSARRVQGSMTFSREYLAQTATNAEFLMQVENAIGWAISGELANQVINDATLTLAGRASGATKTTLTYEDAMLLQGSVDIEDFTNARFVAGKSLYYGMKTLKKDAGSGLFLAENSMVDGVPVVNAGSKLSANKLIFGDFKHAHVATFGDGVEILVDPYSLASTGQVKITYTVMADAKVNPYAFRSIQNVL